MYNWKILPGGNFYVIHPLLSRANFLAYGFIVLSDYDIIESMVMVTAWMKIMQSMV